MTLQDLPTDLRQKLVKIFALVEGGKTEGEKAAARAALNRVLEKHDLRLEDFKELACETRWFKFRNILECNLLMLLKKKLFPFSSDKYFRKKDAVRNVALRVIGYLLNYTDYVMLDCAYGYFREHMKQQFLKHANSQDQKFRKKGNAKGSAYLRSVFFAKYIAESDLYVPDEDVRENFRKELLGSAPMTKEEAQERADRLKAHKTVNKVAGGTFHQQVSGSPAPAQIGSAQS